MKMTEEVLKHIEQLALTATPEDLAYMSACLYLLVEEVRRLQILERRIAIKAL